MEAAAADVSSCVGFFLLVPMSAASKHTEKLMNDGQVEAGLHTLVQRDLTPSKNI